MSRYITDKWVQDYAVPTINPTTLGNTGPKPARSHNIGTNGPL